MKVYDTEIDDGVSKVEGGEADIDDDQ